ncbi:MAG: copper-translocating P-type ATPase [Campylobacterales bacterium]|nr:copper-translocating P-type ATPase [Campylobacterales bacterium]
MQAHTSHNPNANHAPYQDRHNSGHLHHMEDLKQRFIISIILTIPILLFSSMIQMWFGFTIDFPYMDLLTFTLSTLVYLYGGWPFLTMMTEEIKSKEPGMMTLISMAISVAYFYSAITIFISEEKSFFWELATLIDIMLIGHYIEAKSILGASNTLEELVRLVPKKAMRFTHEDTLEEVDVSQLRVGDTILIHPGENIPADGEIIKGESMVDEALLTGESKPLFKSPESLVFMGSTNIDGSLRVRITKSGESSYLSQIINLVKELQQSKSHTQDLANRAAKWLFYAAVAIGAITLLVWSVLSNFEDAVLRMVTVLVIACPHALGLAVPLVVAISTSMAAKNGILIRQRDAFERLHKIDVICFDKTGTITEGKLAVSTVAAIGDEKSLLYFAASTEQHSEHGIAQAIVHYAQNQGFTLGGVEEFNAMPGIGAKAKIDGHIVMIGGAQLLIKESLQIPQKLLPFNSHEATKVWITIDGVIGGVILLTDTIRQSSAEAIGAIKSKGITAYMFTGDNNEVAADIAKKTGIDHYEAGLLPDVKLQKIQALKESGKIVAMVGDGINDAPALIGADIGIAIGAGTDIAIESADIILTKSDLLSVVDAITLSKQTYRKMLQNIWWASGYNIIAIPLAAGVLSKWGILINPAVGAILMSASTVIVAINAQLLKNIKPQQRKQLVHHDAHSHH